MSRPEHLAPPEFFYNKKESQKYTKNSRIVQIQRQLSERAYELLGIPSDGVPRLLLDLGCGSGLSGEVLTDHSHHWVGLDISEAMLNIANDYTSGCSKLELDDEESMITEDLDNDSDGDDDDDANEDDIDFVKDKNFDLFLQDLGDGVGFRPGSFDGAISISVIQWLCNADKSSHNPKKRLEKFFSSLFSALGRGCRCVFQFYPENSDQINMITNAALKCGFTGGVVIDYPQSKKAKKYYLVLSAGYDITRSENLLPLPLDIGNCNFAQHSGENDDEFNNSKEGVQMLKRKTYERRGKGKGKKVAARTKEWILKKKDLARKKGMKNIPLDSKYTARKRKTRF